MQKRSYMAKSGLELDFFNMGNPSKPPTFERKRSFRDIQGQISKIDPEVLKSVIANRYLDSKKSPLSIPPKETPRDVPSFPVCNPTLRLSNWCGEKAKTAPMTIFYSGKVAVFEVSPHKAQDIILKLAEEAELHKSADSSEAKPTAQYLLHTLNGDLPGARRKSLQNFVEKRKESHISPTEMVSENADMTPRIADMAPKIIDLSGGYASNWIKIAENSKLIKESPYLWSRDHRNSRKSLSARRD